MSQSGAAFCFLRVDEKVDVGSEMYLLDTDARGQAGSPSTPQP